MYKKIPEELKLLGRWVCWKAIPDESRPGKIKKIPVNAKTGGQAQSNNPDTWCDFQTAVSRAAEFQGIGFMFGGGYFGVDIDDADDSIEEYRAGLHDNIVYEFIHTLQSYTEYSVSGKGIHIICKGSLPQTGRRKKNVEMYSEGRFFIMTGNIASEYIDIIECTEAIKPLHEKYIGGGAEPTTGIANPGILTLSESEILKLAENSKQGIIFMDLYRGNWQSYFQSQSEADMSFCNMLAFWCQRNELLMDSIFRSSGLIREKWHRRQSGSTYGALTVSKAARQCTATYEPEPEYQITIGTVKQPEKKLYGFDDTGNAQHFVDLFGENVRYSFIAKNWLYYDGRKWCYDETGAVRRLVDEMLLAMPSDIKFYIENTPPDMDSEDFKEAFLKHIKKTRSSQAKKNLLKESEHRVPILPEDLDKHKMLLNTPNGIINLKLGDLKPHNAEKYITKITYAEYTDKIDCPQWERFLFDIFSGDRELIRYVQKAVGYSLTGVTVEHCVFFCYGTGRNGKSTFLDLVAESLGDYAANIQPETIMMKNGSQGNSGDIARLKGARFVTTVEPNEGVRLNEGLLKQLAGGDRVTACKKYENEFEFTPEFKIWMATNHKPIIRGTDVGIWSRIHLIPFTVQIPDEKMDRQLKFKLKKELPGILKWAVEGCLLWQREGLKIPEAVKAATREYRNEMDVISTFIDDCCMIGVGTGQSGASMLYQTYARWADTNHEYKMSSRKFGLELGKRFEKVKNREGWHYKGIELLEKFEPYQIAIVTDK